MAEGTLTISTGDYPPSPLSPFLPWCREQLSSEDEETLRARLSRLAIPPAHEDLLFHYLKGRPREREETVLPMEKDFERRRLFKSVILLFRSLAEGRSDRLKIHIDGPVSHFSDQFYSVLEEYLSEEPGNSVIMVNTGEIIPWDGVSQLPPPEDSAGTDEELYSRALEFYLFGDNIRACQYFYLLYAKGRKGSLKLDARERASLFRLYGTACLNLNQVDQALKVFSSLMNLGIVWSQNRFTSLAYRMNGEVYRRKGRTTQAVRFFRKSLSYDGLDDKDRFEALFFLSLCRRGDGSVLSEEERQEALELAGKLNRPRSEGIIILYSDPSRLDRVVQLFKERDNPILLTEALLIRGSTREREEDLKEALRISRQWQHAPLETKILMTRGEREKKRQNMERAYAFHRKALDCSLLISRFDWTAQTLIGLAEIGLYISEHIKSRYFLRMAQYILNRLPRSSPQLKERVKLLTAFTFHSEGEVEKARELYNALPGSRESGSIEDALAGFFPAGLPRRKSPGPAGCIWFEDSLDREIIVMNLKQHVRYEQLKKSMYEINLLSDIQAIPAETEDKDMLILLTMERLLSSSLISGISYYERMEDSYRLAYHSSLLEEKPDRADLDSFLELWDRNDGKLPPGNGERLYLPVYLEKILSGVIICRPEHPLGSGLEENNRVFAIAAGQFSSALERIRQKELILSKNRQLEEMNRELTVSNMTDSLTGIGNRNQMNEKIRQFSRRYSGHREKDNFALLFIDLDNFKFYNDSYGHPMGDRLLEEVSRLFMEACRESDWVFRYGGDEFVILLAETDSESSTLIADRILYELDGQEGYGGLLSRNGFPGALPRENWLGCSIGISDFRKAEKDGNNLLQQADTALYGAKEAGKRQWKIYKKDGKNE